MILLPSYYFTRSPKCINSNCKRLQKGEDMDGNKVTVTIEGVCVRLLESNNLHWPVGSDVWVHRVQVYAII